jgi:hypothetical protein
MAENRQKTKTNGHILIDDMHTSNVMGRQAMITKTRELLQLPAQIQRVFVPNEEFREALNKLERAQQHVIHRKLVDVENQRGWVPWRKTRTTAIIPRQHRLEFCQTTRTKVQIICPLCCYYLCLEFKQQFSFLLDIAETPLSFSW